MDSGVTGLGLGFCGVCAGKNVFFAVVANSAVVAGVRDSFCCGCGGEGGGRFLWLWSPGRVFFFAVVPWARYFFASVTGARVFAVIACIFFAVVRRVRIFLLSSPGRGFFVAVVPGVHFFLLSLRGRFFCLASVAGAGGGGARDFFVLSLRKCAFLAVVAGGRGSLTHGLPGFTHRQQKPT